MTHGVSYSWSALLLRGMPLPLAVIGHEGSTVLVSLNGLRLLGFREEGADSVRPLELDEVSSSVGSRDGHVAVDTEFEFDA